MHIPTTIQAYETPVRLTYVIGLKANRQTKICMSHSPSTFTRSPSNHVNSAGGFPPSERQTSSTFMPAVVVRCPDGWIRGGFGATANEQRKIQ